MRSRRRPSAPPQAVAVVAAVLALASCGGTDGGGGGGGAESAPPDRAARQAPAWDTDPDSVAAIGDSITRAFDACSVLSDCPEASWATGTDASVSSVALQLLGGDEQAVADHTWNLAETGATVADLPAQASAAMAHDPELVTVLIGANDACADGLDGMTEPADFRAALEETMDIVREASPRTQVYMSSVPDLLRLYTEGTDSTVARAVWRLADICPSMLGGAGTDDAAATERRAAVRERVEEYNAVIEDVCSADDLCRYDGGAVFGFAFTPDHLSEWDWFHPSRTGQAELAALAYEQITAG
ncbi:GDSL-type esterase/lipase family protein [Streptomyces sp. RFCAC02]|uniref:GDSL-type esterase/lipase family protein n=1 Tax=Streptomyces sp. RFCAC02 TaxID=2499143 RepID=UPI00101FCE86|nr:GDSL-type esterase/lipase family protein [Streptomyces sp. RFCAC02]